MKHRGRILTIAVVAWALVALFPGQRAIAMPASLLMFYGDPLKTSVLVTGDDARTFGDLQRNGVSAPSTTGRAFIKVAIFYGPANDPAVNRVPVDKLTPEMAWQHGRFFPATATQPALFLITRMDTKGPPGLPGQAATFVSMGPVSSGAIAVLKRLGIPTGPAK